MDNIQDYFIVTAIKGGGSAYVSPAVILRDISKRVGMPLAKFSDLVVGSSSGWIVGGSLCMPSDEDPTQPKYNCDDLINFAFEKAPDIFKRPFNHKATNFFQLTKPLNYGAITFGNLYPSENLLSVFRETYQDLTVQDSITPLAAPVLNYETGKTQMILGGFDNETVQRIHKKTGMPFPNFKMSDAMTAACSATPYFPIYKTPTVSGQYDQAVDPVYAFYDGGLRHNNPIKFAYSYAKQIMETKGIKDKKILILNVGLDSDDNTLSVEDIEKGGFVRLFNPRNDIPITYILRDRDGYDDLHTLYLENNLDIVELTPRYTEENVKKLGHKYSLDKAEAGYLNGLIDMTDGYIDLNEARVDKVAKLIKNEHALRKQNVVIPITTASSLATGTHGFN